LSPAQREAIGEELRDHFESRLTELINAGKSHDEAVRLALAEFGDAAGLAAEFTHISIARRRRLVMRCTVASVVALAAAVFMAMAIWPDNHRVVKDAMADNAAKSPEKSEAAVIPTEDSLNAETEAKFEQFVTVDVADQPLSEYFSALSEKLHVNVMFDATALKDASIDPTTTPIGVALKDVRLRTLLNLMLEEHRLAYIVRDGILFVTTTDKANATLVIKVYDCRAILSADSKSQPVEKRETTSITIHKSDFEHESIVAANSRPIFQLVQAAPAAPSNAKRTHASPSAERLIDVITASVASPTWDIVGGQGSICEYNGLLVVSQTREVHQQVADLLDQIAGKLAAAKK
jgi:hypothetical protein